MMEIGEEQTLVFLMIWHIISISFASIKKHGS